MSQDKLPDMVRIIDPNDIHHRRLVPIMANDGDQIEVWVAGHPDDYRHTLHRSQVTPVEGEWQPVPDGGGMLFYEHRAIN